MNSVVEQRRAELRNLCGKYGITRLDLIGSALRSDFDPDRSDLDFVVEFDNLIPENAADRYLGLLVDLEDLFGRKVDLISYRAIRNPYFKRIVDDTRVTLYAA